MTTYLETRDFIRRLDTQAGIRRAIDSHVQSHLDKSDEEIAALWLAESTASQLSEYAFLYIADLVWRVRRANQRAIEDYATNPAPQEPTVDRRESVREQRESWLSDPRTMPLLNSGERKAFRKWAGDRFDDWYERALAIVKGGGDVGYAIHEPGRPMDDVVETFKGDWHPDGMMAYAREKLVDSMIGIMRERAAQIRLEVTAELLGSEFALGDGTRVTWGQATIAQHQQRIALLAKNAAANVDTAARHQAAIEMIADSQAVNLAGCSS